MKTSNKLLITLLIFSIFAIAGFNFSLKTEFDKIDKTDPYYSYTKQSMKPFKYVKLTGNIFGITQIEPGKTFEVRTQKFDNYAMNPKIDCKVTGDTLFVHYKTNQRNFPFSTGSFEWPAIVFIKAPELSGVTSEGISCKVKGWQKGAFSVVQKDYGVVFSDNHFDELSINSKSGSYVNINWNNTLGKTTVFVNDSSKVIVEKDIFKSFEMHVDSSANISLPGSLLKKTLRL